jgi:hypothetical protein
MTASLIGEGIWIETMNDLFGDLSQKDVEHFMGARSTSRPSTNVSSCHSKSAHNEMCEEKQTSIDRLKCQ